MSRARLKGQKRHHVAKSTSPRADEKPNKKDEKKGSTSYGFILVCFATDSTIQVNYNFFEKPCLSKTFPPYLFNFVSFI